MFQSVFDLTSVFALLVLRVAVGGIFVAHGYQKVFKMGPAQFGGWLKSLAIPFPTLSGYIVSYTELIGGIALMLGIFTPLAATLIAATMVVAIVKVNGSKGLVGGYEFELMLLAAAIAVALAGPGAISIDRLIGLV